MDQIGKVVQHFQGYFNPISIDDLDCCKNAGIN